jgi:ACS family tartrate transporter-like MFS transporter
MSQEKLFIRCARRLIPFLTLLYVVNFLDRVNVGFAALTMNKDLGFSPAVFGFGAGIFFAGYALFQVPANVMLERMGARRWIFSIMAVWGALSAFNAFVRSASEFYLLRFTLGAVEAGFVPGIFFYLTLWFPPSYRARFIASFMAAAPMSAIVGGPLSGAVLGMNGGLGLAGWQWLFLIEGLPACVLAIAVLKFLPDGPEQAAWLSPNERAEIVESIRLENPVEHHDLWRALRDPRIIALGFVNFGVLAGANGVSLWLPQIVRQMGFSNLMTGFIVALPSLASTIVMIAWGRSSDARNERVWHVAIPALIAASSFVLASLAQIDLFLLIALSVTQIMLWSAIAPLIAMPSGFLGGSAAAGGIALVVSIGQLGGFMGSTLIGVLKQHTGDYAAAMAAIGFILILSAITALALGRATNLNQTTADASRVS